MTLAKRYGGVVPTLPAIDPKDTKPGVKVTRWISKKHAHLFPMVRRNTKTSIPRISRSSTSNYDEEFIKATAEIVREYISELERPEVAAETEAPIMIDSSTKCCPSDFSSTNSESTYPILCNYESFCSHMLKRVASYCNQWIK